MERPRGKETETKIARLCLVARLTGRSSRGKTIYLGWTADDRPFGTTEKADLSKEAQESLEAFELSGALVDTVDYSEVKPVLHVTTGQAIDVKDRGSRKSEDIIVYLARNEEGEQIKFSVGELTVLKAIARAKHPWQDLSSYSPTDIVVDARPMHSLFIPGKNDPERALAVLFKPLLTGESNEATFKAFVKSTISRLLIIDESQEPDNRKGYIEEAAKYYAPNQKKGSLMSSLFVDYASEAEREAAEKRSKQRKIGALKFFKKIGVVDFDDKDLAFIEHPLHDYDLEKLSLEELISLASDMARRAERQIE